MGTRFLCVCLALFAIAALPLAAQDEEKEKSERIVYASYFYCDATRLAEVDELIAEGASVWDQAVTDGKMNDWGWLIHHTGGKWRRVFYGVGSDIESLNKAMNEAGAEVAAMDPDNKFNDICGGHEDYIWSQVTGSGEITGQAPNFAYSIYMKCDPSSVALADTLFKTFYEPAMNEAMGEGGLGGWGYLAHVVGGHYNRLLAMRGADMSSVMDGADAAFGAVFENHPEVGRAVNEICSSHSDNLWVNWQPEADEGGEESAE